MSITLLALQVSVIGWSLKGPQFVRSQTLNPHLLVLVLPLLGNHQGLRALACSITVPAWPVPDLDFSHSDKHLVLQADETRMVRITVNTLLPNLSFAANGKAHLSISPFISQRT